MCYNIDLSIGNNVMLTLKEAREQGHIHYVSNKPCNRGHVGPRYVSTRRCVECTSTKSRRWEKDNRDKALDNQLKSRNREGCCVYKAIYPSGTYIGSGLTRTRRSAHTTGSSRIAKSLGETALSFEILVIGSQRYCREVEGLLITNIGLDSLLNKRGGPSHRK